MHIQSLLNIEPDKLFEKSSIQEIEDIQKKLLNEIERKREEIRTMVGERYRDLIEAADTISQMKVLSKKVIEDVNKMKIATAELQEQQLSGFKIESASNKTDKDNVWGCVAAQIKALIDITEVIWEEVDQANFTRATLLFLLARYIKTSLEINPNYKTAKHFPVVSRQWNSLAHFKDTIVRGAEETLKTNHSSQITCSALVSLALLENLTSSQLLDRYLSLQSDALKAVLASSQFLDGEVIKKRLCDSYTLIVHVIIAIFHCFVEHVKAKEGLLWKELTSQVGQHALPTVQLLDQETVHIPLSLLPSAINQFRPVVDQPLTPLPEAKIHEAITDWLVWVRGLVHDSGSHLLQRISSLRALQGLRDAPPVSEEWTLIGQRLVQLPSLDLWNDLYRSLITVRAQQLVSVHWESAFKAIQLQIRTAYEDASNEGKNSEVNLLWYIWKESTSDLNNINHNKNTKGLWLKSRGITPQVADLCGDFERKLSSLLEDLAALCPEQEIDSTLLTIFQTLKAHQQTTCAALITKLTGFVASLAQDTTVEAGALLLAKFLQSVPELCPSLSRCLSYVDTKGVSWQESHYQLQSECLACYKVWQKLASARLLARVTEMLSSVVPDLHSFPQWEEISIEEEGEAGEKLQSILKVPCSPSLNLQSALYHMAGVIAHVAVPKHIVEQLVETVLASVIGIYRKNLELELTQTQFLQMVLDVKYLTYLYNTSISKDLKTQCQETSSRLESKVDPFDLNVFTPYINNNVKISVQRTQALLGVGSCANVPALTSHHSDEPNVLALSSSASTWFPLLHITAPRTANTPAKPKGKKSSISTSTSNTPSDSSSKSTTSSFFGAMATDWFG